MAGGIVTGHAAQKGGGSPKGLAPLFAEEFAVFF
jgi:hypothetical protein